MIWNKKWLMLLTSALILLPMLVGILFWNELPVHMAIHWGLNGEVDGWGGRSLAVFGLPLILLALHWLCVWITLKDPKNEGQSSKIVGMTMWIMPLTSLLVSGIIYTAAFGRAVYTGTWTFCFLGLLFLVIGNYMPKCRQNSTVGIKVKWALENEENWRATHRVGGMIWAAVGVVFFLCAFLPEELAVSVMLVLILVAALVPIAYSYAYYRKQRREGTWKNTRKPMAEKAKRFTVISAVLAVVVLIFALATCFTGDVKVHFNEDAFTIEASYWDDLTVAYQDVDGVEYREDFDAGLRTFGFGSPRLSMGAFRNDDFGDYTLYGYTRCQTGVVITVDDKVLVVTGRDAAATEKIYQELAARVQ